MIPDAERVVGKWVRDHATIAALGARVASKTPQTMTAPWVKLTQVAATDVAGGHEHLIEYLLQFDCYAGDTAMSAQAGVAEANNLARTVRAALKDLEARTFESAVCTYVSFVGMPHLPDDDFEPARERFVLDAEVMLHGVPA